MKQALQCFLACASHWFASNELVDLCFGAEAQALEEIHRDGEISPALANFAALPLGRVRELCLAERADVDGTSAVTAAALSSDAEATTARARTYLAFNVVVGVVHAVDDLSKFSL